MSDIVRIPLSEVLGDIKNPEARPKIEQSWSNQVPQQSGANAPTDKDFDRNKAIIDAVRKKQSK